MLRGTSEALISLLSLFSTSCSIFYGSEILGLNSTIHTANYTIINSNNVTTTSLLTTSTGTTTGSSNFDFVINDMYGNNIYNGNFKNSLFVKNDCEIEKRATKIYDKLDHNHEIKSNGPVVIAVTDELVSIIKNILSSTSEEELIRKIEVIKELTIELQQKDDKVLIKA